MARSPINISLPNIETWRNRPWLASAIALLILCLTPTILNTLGIDFSSSSLSLKSSSSSMAQHDLTSYSGELLHAFLEWSAITIALLVALTSIVHFKKNRDVAAPVIGLAVLIAGGLDSYHILAALQIIEPNYIDSNFIPITWAVSRCFYAIILVLAVVIILFVNKHQTRSNKNASMNFKVLAISFTLFSFLALATIFSTVTAESFPPAVFPEALIKRPYDLLPLALFVLAGALLSSWDRASSNPIRLATMLSLIPAIVTQAHMVFGSSHVSDNHFNIAHVLKVLTYLCLFFGFILDVMKDGTSSSASKDKITSNLEKPKGFLEVGKAKRPLALQLPVAAFVLSLLIAMIIAAVFYFENLKIIKQNEIRELQSSSELIKPFLSELYSDAQQNITFLSNTPPIQGIIRADVANDHVNTQLWRNRLEQIFSKMLQAKPDLTSIHYVQADKIGQSIVSAVRKNNGIFIVPESRLSTFIDRRFFNEAEKRDKGDVYFSKIELERNSGRITVPHTPVMHVATPIFDDYSGEIFGIVIVTMNFHSLKRKLQNSSLIRYPIFLANQEGDFLIHPNPNRTFGFDFGKHYKMQNEFPKLRSAIIDNEPQMFLEDYTGADGITHFSGLYSTLSLNEFGSLRPLRLLLLYHDEKHLAAIHTLRNRSLFVAFSLSIIAVALSIFASRRLTQPLSQMTAHAKKYETTGLIGELPVYSKDETGVLARSFHNLILAIEQKAKQKKFAESEMEKALNKAEDSARLKSEFLASMSHEIRTPINGVMGMLDLLHRGDLSDKQRHYTNLARTSADSLLTVINDILDFSKIEAGKLDIELIDFDLLSQLGDFAESMAVRAEEKGLEVILDVAGIHTSHVIGDPGRIRQILSNLVHNAIKFTEQGEVLMRFSTEELGDRLYLHGCIKDTGIGIAADKQAALFDSFTQVDASTTRKFGGTGLGLAIVKQLCELMDGSISVDSKAGVGSEFKFTLALSNSEITGLPVPPFEIQGLEILIIDDNATSRSVLREQLKLWGARITEANHAQEAVNLMVLRKNKPFDIALIDLNMPNMNGVELTEAIRHDPSFDQTRLILMTPIRERIETKRLNELGVSASFPKPATINDFHRALVTATGTNTAVNYGHAETHQAKSDGNVLNGNYRLLLVEDNAINQEVALSVLEGLNQTADIANNGLEAIRAVNAAPQDASYDAILMDCQMPEMDGYEATKAIRNKQAGHSNKDIIIIAMTANALKGDREKCIAAGMNDYLTKPIDPQKLKDVLIQWLNPHSDIHRMPPPELEHTTEAPTELNNQPNPEIWDVAVMNGYLGNNASLANTLLTMYLNDYPGWLQLIDTGIQENSMQMIWETSHTLKGASANLGAKKVTDISQALEAAGRNNDASQMEKLNAELKVAVAKFVDTLNEYREQLFPMDEDPK